MASDDKKTTKEIWGLPDAPAIVDVDTKVINGGPAIYANKLYATTSPQGLRLTFAEVNPSDPTPAFRSAVFLSYGDAAALLDLLQRQLAPIEQAILTGEFKLG